MTHTSPIICFGSYNALKYKQNNTLNCSVGLQPFSKINDLKMHSRANKKPYATYEPDFWLLDGNYKFKPVDDNIVHVGLMTLGMSNDIGEFGAAPVLTIEFSADYDTDGLIFYFDSLTDNYSTSVNVKYFDAADAVLKNTTYYPDENVFTVEQVVEGLGL